MSATLEFELGPKDLEAFFEHHTAHAPYLIAQIRRARWVFAFLLGALALVCLALAPIVGAVYAVFVVVVMLTSGRRMRRATVRLNKRIHAGPDGIRLGTVTMALADGHLVVEDAESSTTYKMVAIRRIEESPGHYFIYMGPTMALIVPRRVAQADAFIAGLRDMQAAAIFGAISGGRG